MMKCEVGRVKNQDKEGYGNSQMRKAEGLNMAMRVGSKMNNAGHVKFP